jgi:iron complex transport system substrate-binding protein
VADLLPLRPQTTGDVLKRSWLLLLVVSYLFTGCGNSVVAEVTYQPTTTHGIETLIPVEAPSEMMTEEPTEDTLRGPTPTEKPKPRAIVSLSPTATEMLFAIDAGPQVIAVDTYSYFPSDAPVVENLFGWNPNVEAVASLEPDLVVMSDAGIAEELEALGIDVYVAPAAQDLEQVYAQIADLGEITGNTESAWILIETMKIQIANIIKQTPKSSKPLTYFHELDDTLYSVTSTTFIGELYQLAGLENIADSADEDGSSGGYPQLTQEFILEADPDIIFFADAECCGQSTETIASRPGWSELKAVRNGNVVEIDNDISSRWGPRIIDFLVNISAAVSALMAG